jgi:hypothetical protein
MRGGTVGRDVGRDEGREQAEWRDLVARLELQAPVDPASAPWPERENLRAKAQPATGDSSAGSGGCLAGAVSAASAPPDAPLGALNSAPAEDDGGPADHGNPADGNPSREEAEHGTRWPADRSRVIRPAGFARFCGPPADPADPAALADAELAAAGSAEAADAEAGPRDYELAEPGDDDLDDWADRYVPPPAAPQPKLDPVAKGAWLALFGGPGYLLVATLLSWQIAGWAALAAVIAFVSGFIVLVFRLGDGPSKKDGPDQGAVV